MVKIRKVPIFFMCFLMIAASLVFASCNKAETPNNDNFRAEFAKGALNLLVEQSEILEVKVYKNDELLSAERVKEYTLLFTSNMPTVATATGSTVTGLTVGKATITVKEANNLFSATIEVTVNEKGDLTVTEVMLKNRKTITFNCDIDGAFVTVGDKQYKSTVSGLNEIEIDAADYLKPMILTIKKYGFNDFNANFMYIGDEVSTFTDLQNMLKNAAGGDVIVMTSEIIVLEEETLVIPKNVILKTGNYIIYNYGKITGSGSLDGTWASNAPIFDNDTIPEDGV